MGENVNPTWPHRDALKWPHPPSIGQEGLIPPETGPQEALSAPEGNGLG